MQFNRSEDGTLTPLPKPSIDTGMGLERVAAVLQGKFNNYDSDLFFPIMSTLEQLSGKTYGDNNQDDTAMRVIADHARATTFLVADGVLPANEGRGYVLRRIMRRAVRYGKYLGLEKSFMEEVTTAVVSEMIDAYPHLGDATSLLAKVVNNEEERFRETLENGLALLDEEISRLIKGKSQVISGSFIFKLYDTFGFPFDIVRDIALERGLNFDEAGFMDEMENQRQKSRHSRKGEGVKLLGEGVKSFAAEGKKAEFIGYDESSVSTRVEGLLNLEGERVGLLNSGERGRLYVGRTPFYAESGGQIGDCGEIKWVGGRAKVTGTSVEGEKIILHAIDIVEGELAEGSEVTLFVERGRRRAIAAHHSATHLLQAALRKVLGDHVKQAGSLVGPDRLRFDFTHFSPLSPGEIEAVEYLVNEKIWDNIPIVTQLLAKEDAVKAGATALFGEKYEENVRVVSMADFSKELCGGTHVQAAGEIGVFKIQSEGGIASGVRRIEALAGRAAFDEIQALSRRERLTGTLLNAGNPEEITGKVENLVRNIKSMEKQVAELSRQLASSDLDSVFDNAVIVGGIKVIGAEIPLDSPKTLREVGDKVRDSLGSGVAVLGGTINGKAALLAIVSSDLTSKVKAGDLVNRVAKIVGGKGGGRPDMAQAGGPMIDKISEAIKSVPKAVKDLLQ
jgi:alanyl-tRNA synthetase